MCWRGCIFVARGGLGGCVLFSNISGRFEEKVKGVGDEPSFLYFREKSSLIICVMVSIIIISIPSSFSRCGSVRA